MVTYEEYFEEPIQSKDTIVQLVNIGIRYIYSYINICIIFINYNLYNLLYIIILDVFS